MNLHLKKGEKKHLEAILLTTATQVTVLFEGDVLKLFY